MMLDHADSHYALEAKGLTVVLGGQEVLNVPSLQMNPNEALVIIGPNGSGKTTLLLCLAMLLKPEDGIVFTKEYRCVKQTMFSSRDANWLLYSRTRCC